MIIKNYTALFFFLLLILMQNLHAQNINGLQVYVSKCCVTTLFFHNDVDKLHFGETNCPYKVESLMMDKNSVPLTIKNEVKESYILYVNEGGRKHRFTIVYKDDIEFADREKDFSDLKQLKKLIEALNNPGEKNNQNNAGDEKNNTDAGAQHAAGDVNNNLDNSFAALITQADQLKKSGQLEEAEKKYNRALQVQTDNNYAQAGLQEVRKLIKDREAAKYNDIVTKANNAFMQDKLNEALEYYTEAAAINPDNIYVNNQLQLIQKKLSNAKAEEESRQKDSLFNSYINTGDKALNDKLYSTAKIAYKEALKIKPGNAVAMLKSKTLDDKIISDSTDVARQRNEALYTSYIKAGDKALNDKLYSTAKIAYNEALKIRLNDADAKTRLKKVDEKIIADSLEIQRKRNADLYAAYINMADKAFNKKSYDVARSDYDSAMKVKPNDVYAKAQVKKINDALLELQKQAQRNVELQQNQERRKEYESVISAADKQYNSGMYEEAKAGYNKALALNKDDSYSKNKITQINKILADLKLKEAADRKKQQQDSVNNIKYTEAIAKADKSFETKDYSYAKILYTAALKYKDDEYAKNKLNEIEKALAETAAKDQTSKDSISKATGTNKKYAALLANAKTAYSKNDYTTARIMYAAAAELKPNEAEPKTKLEEINNKLTEIQKVKELEKKCDSLISIADISLADQQLEKAMENYKAALSLNTAEQSFYIKKQISFIESRLAKQDSLTVQQKQATEEDEKDEALYNNYIKAGNKAFEEKMYVLAKNNFDDALKIKPNDAYAMSQAKIIDSLNTAKNINAQSNVNKNAEAAKAANEIESGMILIKAHLFKMGNNVGAADESPVHIVKLDSFYIAKYEVTQSQWQSIMGSNPSQFKNCNNCPVENISWNDAIKFIQKLNAITNKKYRLPTEAEWEFVAGSQSMNENINNIAWYNDNSKKTTHAAGKLKPDYLGVYDMFGNVEEWCSDWYDFRSYRRSITSNPKGAELGKEKVIRGGSWYDMEGAFRIQIREKADPNKAGKKTGFRLALDIN